MQTIIGNTPKAFGQTWHLPCDDHRLTYKQFTDLASVICQQTFRYKVIGRWMLDLGAVFNKRLKELQELLPRYAQDNIFISDKFK